MKRFLKGFSLIELLVTIAVIALLSGIVFIGYSSGERQLILNRAASKLAQDIRRVEGMALSTEKCCGGIIPGGGYGIYLGNAGDTSYLLYADTSSACVNCAEQHDAGDQTIETINFEKGVKIQLLYPTSLLSINFKPPDPKIKINGDSATEATITITLETDSSKTKTVKVTKAGLIEIQ